jgi:hypothetical protein
MQHPTRPRNPADTGFLDRAATRLAAAAIVAALAFGLYATTLLPGQDLGDTAAFQFGAEDRALTPRQGYPLYFATCRLFLRVVPSNPALATNLASAVEASLAVGLVVLVGAELGGTLVAGLVAGLLLAGSYTFWSQAVIAEVYSLHALVVSLCLLALLHWHRRPSTGRLALFFAAYALGFGNHLQLALLLPAFAMFLLVAAPGGPRSILGPRVLLLAASIAAVFALQYAWNFSSLYFEPDHRAFPELLRAFWFDVTKSDWRASMVGTISRSMLGDRIGMYWFDVRQQVGLPGVAAALAGLAFLFRTSWRLGALVLVAWLVNWAFAFGYNVGDAHVFFLPSHLFVALAAGCGAGWAWHAVRWHVAKARQSGRPRWAAALVGLLLLAYPAWRAWDTYPAMDRSADRTPTAYFDSLTQGLSGHHEILARELNWQLHNGFDYYARYTKPSLPVLDTLPSLLYFPFIAWDNAAMGRDVVLTAGAARLVRSAYGDLFPIERDPRVGVETLREKIASLPPGTPYVLTVMNSYRETPLDPAEMREVASLLGLDGGLPAGRYVVVAGRTGAPPALIQAGMRPFRASTELDGRRVEVRIECWLPSDTIRRMGFGHVIADRRHVLAIDRGASFVTLTPQGTAGVVAWAGGLFAPQPRYVIRHDARRP